MSCGCIPKCPKSEGTRLPSSILNIRHVLKIRLHFILIVNKCVRSQNAAKIRGLCTAN